jgi:hypothetical protein
MFELKELGLHSKDVELYIHSPYASLCSSTEEQLYLYLCTLIDIVTLLLARPIHSLRRAKDTSNCLPTNNWSTNAHLGKSAFLRIYRTRIDRFCGLVVRVRGYRYGGPGSITGITRKKVVGLEQGPLSLVSATEELLDRKVAAPV